MLVGAQQRFRASHVRGLAQLDAHSRQVGAAAMLNVIGDGELHSTMKPILRSLTVPTASVHWCA